MDVYFGTEGMMPLMSLFENPEYQWRETYFILFGQGRRPTAAHVQRELQKLNSRYEVTDVRADEDGLLESLTLKSPDDYAALDISIVAADEVTEQTRELIEELKDSAVSAEDKEKLRRVPACDSRFDVYHFEQLVFVADDEDEADFLDPGALLMVTEKIAELCDGIIVDPQANCFL